MTQKEIVIELKSILFELDKTKEISLFDSERQKAIIKATEILTEKGYVYAMLGNSEYQDKKIYCICVQHLEHRLDEHNKGYIKFAILDKIESKIVDTRIKFHGDGYGNVQYDIIEAWYNNEIITTYLETKNV